MKGIIVYKSVYGSTVEYASWLRDDLKYDLTAVKDAKKIKWYDYDTVIIGSPVFKNRPFLSPWICRNWEKLSHARVVLFTTSGDSPKSRSLREGYEKAFPEEIREQLTYIPLPGRFNYRRLNCFHKMMMQLGVIMQKDADVKERMKEDMKVARDNVERMALVPLVHAILENAK